MASQTRVRRVEEAIKAEVGALLIKGLKDPRIGFVSVMAVRVSSDLRSAKVFVSLYGSEAEKKSSLAGLRNSAGFVRTHIGKVLRLRYAPEVRFFEDETLEDVFRLEEVFKKLHEGEEHPIDGDE
jgi:ribosome-binding factor A